MSIPTLVEEELVPGGVRPSAVFAVEGAVMAVAGLRVGRITGDGIEWLKTTIPPPQNDGLGPLYVSGVYGRWPDSIGVGLERINGRIGAPVYFPLAGVAQKLSGFTGRIVGAVPVGASTIVVANFYSTGIEFETARGTAKRKPMTRDDAGCKAGGGTGPGLYPLAVAATRGGTMVTVGQLCEEQRAGAEIWDTHGQSRVVELGRFWKKMGWQASLLQGGGEDLWAVLDPWRPLLRFHEGVFEAAPDLGRPIRNHFVSPRGALHASDGRVLYRLDATGWTPVAWLPPGRRYAQMVMDDQERIWVSFAGITADEEGLQSGVTADGIRLLRAGPPAPLPPGCATPFVHLYAASYSNRKTYTYPSTRQALSTFPEATTLGLVEFDDGTRRQVGVAVTSMAQGAALVTHLHRTMKEQEPRLMCFDVSAAKEVRRFPVP